METYIKPPGTGMEAFEMMPEGTLCQLINNVLVTSTAPNTLHARVQNKIFVQLYDFVEEMNCGEVFCAPYDVYINEHNVYQPDIVYVAGERKDVIKKKGIVGVPDLVIEVLSEDRNYDLKKKKAVYEQSGVKEYWVVDPETKWCEGWVLNDGVYRSLGQSEGKLNLQLLNLLVTF